MGLGEGREVGAGDGVLVQDQREVGRRRLRAQWTEPPLQARPQGDDIGGMACIAAGVQEQTLRLIDHEGQGDLPQLSALLQVAPTLWETGPVGAGLGRATQVMLRPYPHTSSLRCLLVFEGGWIKGMLPEELVQVGTVPASQGCSLRDISMRGREHLDEIASFGLLLRLRE